VSRYLLCSALLLNAFVLKAQSPFKGLENLFTTPGNYIVYHTEFPPVIDGNINELAWQRVPWTNEFVDIEGADKPKPPLSTKIKILWDDSCLYIAAQLTEPQVWATLKNRDDIVFHDNDFEFFIDPYNTAHNYFEVEVNPLNTIFDLFLNKPYRDGGVPLSSWDVKGLRSAVKIQGTLNDPSDKDEGWTVEIAVPFKSIRLGNGALPREGTTWRANFSRVEWDSQVVDGKYVKLTGGAGKLMSEHNWVWSAQGPINMHYPERWGYLQFSRAEPGSVNFEMPYSEFQKQYLWLIYYREQEWYRLHKVYNKNLTDLGLDQTVIVNKKANKLRLEATEPQFMAFIKDEDGKVAWSISQDGLVKQVADRPGE